MAGQRKTNDIEGALKAAKPAQQHTPGPWRLDGARDIRRVIDETFHVIEAGDPYIGVNGENGFKIYGVTSTADARLIAASPRMYAFIKTLADCGNDDAAELIASI